MPLPMIVCLGVNEVLFGHSVKDSTPVFPGSMHILSMGSKSVEDIICVLHNLAMQTIEPWMFILKLSHKGIPNRTPVLRSVWFDVVILVVFQAKSGM